MPGVHYSTSPEEYTNSLTPANAGACQANFKYTRELKYPTIGPTKPSVLGNALNSNRSRRSSLCYSENATDLLAEISGGVIPCSNSGEVDQQQQNQESARETAKRNILQVCGKCKSALYQTSAIDDEVPIYFSPSSPFQKKQPFQAQHRRKKSWYQSLLGSYEESLLTGRMSAPSSVPIPFHVRIGVSSTESSVSGTNPTTTKTHDQIATDFEAVFYDHDLQETGLLGRGSPYVGIVDLRSFYMQRFARNGKSRGVLGYRVPEQGKLQVIISNSERTAVELFLIDYDLSKVLGPKGKGRTFIRNKTFLCPASGKSNTTSKAAVATADSTSQKVGKSRLVQAIHLQVAGLGKGRYYLFGDIKLTFQSKRGAGESSWLRKLDPLPTTSSGFSVAAETRESITMYGERGKLDTTLLKYRSPDKEEDLIPESASATVLVQMQEHTPGKQVLKCMGCEDSLISVPFGNANAINGDISDATTSCKNSRTVESITAHSAKARVIRTQEQLKAEMLTDTKASSIYPKR